MKKIHSYAFASLNYENIQNTESKELEEGAIMIKKDQFSHFDHFSLNRNVANVLAHVKRIKILSIDKQLMNLNNLKNYNVVV